MYEIAYIWAENYDFHNAAGEHIKGETRKALVLLHNDDDSIVRSTIAKIGNNCRVDIGYFTQLFYNEFGRLVGAQA